MSYDAIYEATRSKIQGGSVDDAIQSAIRSMNLSHYVENAMREFENAAYEQQRWCVLLRPKVFIDGNQWCALYGENIQDGVCGFGDTPALALHNFDNAWNESVKEQNNETR